MKIPKRVEQIPPSGIRTFFDLVLGMKEVISLGVGEPDFSAPWRVREAAIYTMEQGWTSYSSNKGLKKLRLLLEHHLQHRWGLRYDPEEEMLITVGVSQALDIALRAILDSRDEVLILDPSYVAYGPDVILAGARPHYIRTTPESGFKVTPEDLKKHLRATTKAIILNYPNNPTGSTYTKKELEALWAVLKRTDVWVITDEIYGDLTYDFEHTPFATLKGAQERTVYLNGFSKSYAMTGFRVGYALGPRQVIQAMTKIHQYTMLCVSIISQWAACEALSGGQREVEDMKRQYRRRRQFIVEGLRNIGFDCILPQGAFYVFASLRPLGLKGMEFAHQLLKEEKVAVVPGTAFGDHWQDYVRISYACDMENLREALLRMERFLKKRVK